MTDVAVAVARWRSAEDRLYPVAMSDPGSYRHGLAAVQALVAQLRRTAHTDEDLLAAEADPAALVATLPADRPPLPADLLVAAACSARHREIAAAEAEARRAEAVAAARAAGRDWVTLEGPERAADLVGGAAVGLHLPSGRTLVAGVDPYSGADPYRLAEVGPDGATLRERGFADRAAWLAAHEVWGAEIAAAPGGTP